MRSIDTTKLVDEVVSDLILKLNSAKEYPDIDMVKVLVKTVVKEIIQRREYPETMSDDAVLDDLETFYATIFKVSEYDYNMIGAEGESAHSENGVTRDYVDRDKYFSEVYKFVRFFI